MKDYKTFISEIMKREGKKEEVNIAQVKEIVKVIKDIVIEDCGIDLMEIILDDPFSEDDILDNKEEVEMSIAEIEKDSDFDYKEK